eukprot:316653_1
MDYYNKDLQIVCIEDTDNDLFGKRQFGTNWIQMKHHYNKNTFQFSIFGIIDSKTDSIICDKDNKFKPPDPILIEFTNFKANSYYMMDPSGKYIIIFSYDKKSMHILPIKKLKKHHKYFDNKSYIIKDKPINISKVNEDIMYEKNQNRFANNGKYLVMIRKPDTNSSSYSISQSKNKFSWNFYVFSLEKRKLVFKIIFNFGEYVSMQSLTHIWVNPEAKKIQFWCGLYQYRYAGERWTRIDFSMKEIHSNYGIFSPNGKHILINDYQSD